MQETRIRGRGQDWDGGDAWEQWVESLDLPFHKGYGIDDLRTAEVGWWEERGCNAAFVQFKGLEGIAEVRVTGISPGKTTQPWKFALDEVCYVLEGRGLTTVWGAEGSARKTFEWQKHSLFLIPRYSFRQLTNTQGDKPATLLSYNNLPRAMQLIPDLDFFFNNPYLPKQGAGLEDFYSEAKAEWSEGAREGPYQGGRNTWYGNFFPDMWAWDKLDPNRARGAGGYSVFINFPNSTLSVHMSAFDAGIYKKAHRHGPGRFIVCPGGEGYSFLWEEGKEKVFVPWHEGGCFTPPNRWYHQHFNVGKTPARYIAFHSAGMAGYSEDQTQDQIEYSDEDPWIRQTFEKELAKRGLTSLMPDEAYKDRDYQWQYAEDKK